MDKESETNESVTGKPTLKELICMTERLLADLIECEGEPCISIFNSEEIPKISLGNYLNRIHKDTSFSPQCLIIAIIYIDRYNMGRTDFSLNWNNVHRILLTSIMLAVKFHDHIYYDNRAFQKGGGITLKYLHNFQLQIWKQMGYNTFVQNEEYYELLHKLSGLYLDIKEQTMENQISPQLTQFSGI